jgi:hypothetical protein
MMQWVEDVIHTKNEIELFSSNYIIKNNLVPNPCIKSIDSSTAFIMREIYKYDDLINAFYNKMNLSSKDSLNFNLNYIDRYLYQFDLNNKEYANLFKINEDDKIFMPNSYRGNYKGDYYFLKENCLKRISNLIKNIC